MDKHHDSDEHKGVVEGESPHGSPEGRASFAGQLGHRTADQDVKDNDSDFPGPGAHEEHTGEKQS